MLLELQKSDLYRYYANTGFKTFLKAYFLIAGFRFMYWHRLASWTSEKPLLRWLFLLSRFQLSRYRFKLGIDMPWTTEVGPGFYIGHQGTIVVNGRSRIGRNCNISHGVTIGMIAYGKNAGSPQLGDRVYVGPGAKIIGNVVIGDDVAIGANCVVTHDVPAGSVVVGIPAQVISTNGSKGYILNGWNGE